MQLIHGDCLEVLPSLESGSVDAVVTDPPYGMRNNTNSRRFSGGGAHVNRNRRLARDGVAEGRDDWPEVLGDDKPFDPAPWLAFPKVVLWGANHFAARLPVGTTLVWIKRAEHLYGTFLSDAEIGWMKGGHGVYCFRRNWCGQAKQFEAGKCKHSPHPNQKPLALMRWCLGRLKLPPGATVLDPYMGSGTTGVACAELGLNFIGIEENEAYFKAAQRRIADARGPLFAEAK